MIAVVHTNITASPAFNTRTPAIYAQREEEILLFRMMSTKPSQTQTVRRAAMWPGAALREALCQHP
ncbi:hypothetical protein A9W95_23435 [Mycobacterium sp. 1423905.2]|nr:hypothetical protein A9W95_23435 [Mycobacterium sp. 1423905.2]